MERVRFIFPVIDNQTPLSQDNYFKWLDGKFKTKSELNDFYQTIKNSHHFVFVAYLVELGFDVEKHTIDPADLDILKCIEDVFIQRLPYGRPCQLNAIFKQSFLNSGKPLNDFKDNDLTEYGQNLIFNNNIYGKRDNQCSRGYSLKVESGRLYLQYSYIIGSRFLCEIIGE